MKVTGIKSEVLESVQKYVQDYIAISASQNEAAAGLDLSSAHIINYREGNWDKISEKEFWRIAAMAGVTDWQDCATQNFGIAMGLLRAAQEDSRMLGLEGFTGSGKTHALRMYARKNASAYYILADAEMNKKRFLSAILRAIRVKADDWGGNSSEMIETICRKLSAESRPVLIIDDAGKLSDPLIRMIQIIYDRTEGRAGIVIAGTEYLRTMVDKKARRNTMGYREFRRRIAWWERMEEPTKNDIREVCKVNGVTDPEAISFFQKAIADFGTLRNMVTNARKKAEQTGLSVTRELVSGLYAKRDFYIANY